MLFCVLCCVLCVYVVYEDTHLYNDKGKIMFHEGILKMSYRKYIKPQLLSQLVICIAKNLIWMWFFIIEWFSQYFFFFWHPQIPDF